MANTFFFQPKARYCNLSYQNWTHPPSTLSLNKQRAATNMWYMQQGPYGGSFNRGFVVNFVVVLVFLYFTCCLDPSVGMSKSSEIFQILVSHS